MSGLEAPATGARLDALPSLPRDAGEPVFAEPWQAQAFALAVRLSADGHFTWKEWAAALAEELAAALGRGEPDDGSRYYHHWVAALERLVTERGLAGAPALGARKAAWAEAYRNTPHGQPVELKQADFQRAVRASVVLADGREVRLSSVVRTSPTATAAAVAEMSSAATRRFPSKRSSANGCGGA